jgi:hypothetical protein
MTILTVAVGIVLSNKKQPTKFEEWALWMRGFLAVWNPERNKENDCWIRKRNAGLACPAVIAGSRIQPFLEANDRSCCVTVQGSESQIMSETNHAPSIPVFRL